MRTLLSSEKSLQSNGTTLASFKDMKSVAPWATEAVEYAVSHGLLSGRPDGTIAPQDTLTRAEAAQLVLPLVE